MEGLLRKGAVKPVPLDQERSGFYSTYFLVPKRDGGHRPILNLKFFNVIVRKTSFKMETLRSVISVMRPHQWMASVDLKDAYFHLRVVPAHCPVPQIPVARTGLPVRGFALRSVLSPLGLHQDCGPTGGLAQANGGTVIPITLRHPPAWGVSQRRRAVSSDNLLGAHTSGVHSEPEEV